MKIAFYKAKGKLFNRLVRFWTNGPYSHCEVVFSDGVCASSSFMDGGVRFKNIEINNVNWDIIELPNVDEKSVRDWFENHKGLKYDALGVLAVITPAREHPEKWFCNECVGAAIGVREPWRFNPTSFARVCEAMGGKWI